MDRSEDWTTGSVAYSRGLVGFRIHWGSSLALGWINLSPRCNKGAKGPCVTLYARTSQDPSGTPPLDVPGRPKTPITPNQRLFGSSPDVPRPDVPGPRRTSPRVPGPRHGTSRRVPGPWDVPGPLRRLRSEMHVRVVSADAARLSAGYPSSCPSRARPCPSVSEVCEPWLGYVWCAKAHLG